MASIQFENRPLYIINGKIYTGDITALNPEFFQQVEVLKPEDASHIYGVLAANGVVLIKVNTEAMKAISMNKAENVPEQSS